MPQTFNIEAVTSENLEFISVEEIQKNFAGQIKIKEITKSRIRFIFNGNVKDFLKIKTVFSFYILEKFSITRPKALLGDQNLKQIIFIIDYLKSIYLPGTFKSFFINAAGKDSSVMLRIQNEIKDKAKLAIGDNVGDLEIIIRPNKESNSWEVLFRTSNRSLAQRKWLISQNNNSLNPCLSNSIVKLSLPHPKDHYINLNYDCGELLIERAFETYAKFIVGVDNNKKNFTFTQQNIDKANLNKSIDLINSNINDLPFPSESFNKMTSYLPLDDLSQEKQITHYMDILSETFRIARFGSIFILIVSNRKILEKCLNDSSLWIVKDIYDTKNKNTLLSVFVLTK